MKLYISVIHLLVLLVLATPASAGQSPLELVRDTSTQILMTLREEKTSISYRRWPNGVTGANAPPPGWSPHPDLQTGFPSVPDLWWNA